MTPLAAWLADEVRLITASSWADERQPLERAYAPCTSDDPACRRTLARLKAAGERMRRLGIPRLTDQPSPRFTSAAATDIRRLFDPVVAVRGSAAIVYPIVFRHRRRP